MAGKAIFYHAGCPVCVDVEQVMVQYLDPQKVTLEVVHIGEDRSRIAEAEQAGIKSVPALVLNGQVYHINFGASLDDLKNAI